MNEVSEMRPRDPDVVDSEEDFESDFIDLVDAYKSQDSKKSDVAIKLRENILIYMQRMPDQPGDLQANCFHQCVYEFKDCGDSNDIYYQAHTMYQAYIVKLLDDKNWFEAVEHLPQLLENSHAENETAVIDLFDRMIAETDDVLHIRLLMDHFRDADNKPQWYDYSLKAFARLNDTYGADMHIAVAQQLLEVSVCMADHVNIQLACKHILRHHIHLEAVKQVELLTKVLLLGDVKNQKKALQRLHEFVMLVPEMSNYTLDLLGDFYQIRPDLGNANHCFDIASRGGSETAFDKLHPRATAAECHAIAMRDDNAAAFAKLQAYYKAGDESCRPLLAECLSQGCGVDIDLGAAHKLGYKAESRQRCRFSTEKLLLWHDNSYQLHLYQNILGWVQMLGGREFTYLLYGMRIQLSGFHQGPARRFVLETIVSYFQVKKNIYKIGSEAVKQIVFDFEWNNRYLLGLECNDDAVAALQERLVLCRTVTFSIMAEMHAISISFKKIDDELYMIYNNRGLSAVESESGGAIYGHCIFHVGKPEMLKTTGFIHKLLNKGLPLSYFSDFSCAGDGIGMDLQLSSEKMIVRSQQKRGNCSFISAYSAFHNQLMFYFASLAVCRQPGGGINWEKAYISTLPIYKDWRIRAKLTAVDELLNLGNGYSFAHMLNEDHQCLLGNVLSYIETKDDMPERLQTPVLSMVSDYLESDECFYAPADKEKLQRRCAEISVKRRDPIAAKI
ncbi:MAG: hypothetical protein P1U40_11260 [Coxiellaceae bacterium]|nr:hypothetical protein [Coxiellaceae bacterium]